MGGRPATTAGFPARISIQPSFRRVASTRCAVEGDTRIGLVAAEEPKFPGEPLTTWVQLDRSSEVFELTDPPLCLELRHARTVAEQLLALVELGEADELEDPMRHLGAA